MPITPQIKPELRAAFSQSIAAERLRNARLLNAFRLAGVTSFLVMKLVLEVALAAPERGFFPGVLLAYWVLSLGLFVAGWRSDQAARWSRLAVPLLDLPMVFLTQWLALPFSSSPRAVANFTLALNVCLVTLAAFALQAWSVYLAAAVAIGSQLALQWKAQDSLLGLTGGATLILLTVVLCHYAQRRRMELMLRLTDEQIRRERLGRYFSPQVARHIERQADLLATGQPYEVTVLFSDLRDFTALSESLGSAEIVMLLNDFHSRMVEAVFAHDGTLDKYLGDGLMAYFGAPLRQPDHAVRALRCALAMQAALGEMNVQRRAGGQQPLRMGIGLHSGPAVVGSLGAPHRREFTVIGDTVNLASRLEQLTKRLEAGIVLSEATCQAIGAAWDFHLLEAVQIRGRSTPVKVFALAGVRGSILGPPE